jgi:hypothetical protein
MCSGEPCLFLGQLWTGSGGPPGRVLEEVLGSFLSMGMYWEGLGASGKAWEGSRKPREDCLGSRNHLGRFLDPLEICEAFENVALTIARQEKGGYVHLQ